MVFAFPRVGAADHVRADRTWWGDAYGETDARAKAISAISPAHRAYLVALFATPTSSTGREVETLGTLNLNRDVLAAISANGGGKLGQRIFDRFFATLDQQAAG